MSESLQELGPHIGVAAVCVALAMNRTGVYRQRAREMRAGSSPLPRKRRPRPPLSLSIIEQQVLLEILNSERFADMAPASIFATLLDEGRYHGGIRTMYRLLAVQQQSGERRRQRVHPVCKRWRNHVLPIVS